jgi:hypothetical protein
MGSMLIIIITVVLGLSITIPVNGSCDCGLYLRGLPNKSLSGGENSKVSDVHVTLRVLEARSQSLRLELKVHNAGEQPVFVMTDPTRSDGSRGIYVSVDKDDPTVLEINIRLYPRPTYFLYSNAARVRLERIEPNSSYAERYSMNIPTEETMPPYGESLGRNRIDHKVIRSIKATVGILPDEAGIRDLIKRKAAGPFVNGLEEVIKGSFEGKRLIALQELFSSPSIKLK